MTPKSFLDSLKALGPARLLGVAGVGLAALAIVAAVALRGGGQPMSLLYGDLDLQDSGQVVAVLDKQHIPYELQGGGTRILVPSDQVDRLRLTLAADNLPAGGSVGYEVFDRGDSLTSNQFQQQMNQLRALEGELARTIRTIRGVRNARVHLVLARREPFAREQQEAQASIVLAMAGGRRMDEGEVQAIVNLVAAAVPGLKVQNVSVVDSRGELLARPGRPAGEGAGGAGGNADARRVLEQRLGQQVEDMLGRTLGPGRVRAEASVDMDFDRVNETEEKFDPDGQVPRTTQTVTDGSKSTEPQAGVSVQNNLPNPDSQAGGASGSATNHQEENTTFEIGKTVRTVVRDTPSVRRVSMAVLVDGQTLPGPDGKPAWHALSPSDLDQIAMLVKSAIGYDEKRGDHVEVVNMRFSTPDPLGEPDPPAAPWLQLGRADLIWLATIGLIALVALFALVFVVRPMALRLTSVLAPVPVPPALPAPRGASPATPQAASPGALAGGVPMGGEPAGVAAGEAAGADPARALVPATDQDTLLNIANIDGAVRASAIRRLGELVENEPDATVSVIRGWLAHAPGAG